MHKMKYIHKIVKSLKIFIELSFLYPLWAIYGQFCSVFSGFITAKCRTCSSQIYEINKISFYYYIFFLNTEDKTLHCSWAHIYVINIFKVDKKEHQIYDNNFLGKGKEGNRIG